MPDIHPALSVEDALTMLDTRIPLLQAEKRMVLQSLWDTAFREGARQGRQAAVEETHHDSRAERLIRDIPEYPEPRDTLRDKLLKVQSDRLQKNREDLVS